ncbi:hypothetical protein KFL_003580100 [Klebsormidium nitens]|uniref:GTD-binding domain-containing protein n=1 Tax=Klebsormidium nitens TaxID=105231 RepID=A0A1Y1IFK6_KLENI|nr:hypothetical protein KFL_003580100 [Klebsormidium nitens]|eukprot:GAQ87517.1 hypothetical protein KFL_003580100 [Klebsormidium nitens]
MKLSYKKAECLPASQELAERPSNAQMVPRMAAVLRRLSAIVLGVLELVLAAITLLRVVVVVGIALAARVLAYPPACTAVCLCCGQQLHSQSQGAEQGSSGRGVRATATADCEGEHPRGAMHATSYSSSRADSCGKETNGVSDSAKVPRCQAWSQDHSLFDQKVDCLERRDALRGLACAVRRECRSTAVPARGDSPSGQDCLMRGTCGAHEGGPTSPAVVLSSMQTKSTPAGMSLQLSLAVDIGRGACPSNQCTHADTLAGHVAPGSCSGAVGASGQWPSVEELQQELDEERSAAEEAAAEALRMITRLQSEKAALAAQLRQAAQREQEAALQHGALVDALEGAIAQLEQERAARHREKRHHRARFEAHGARWQPGCARLALLDAWHEGGAVPVQVQPVLLGGPHGGVERGAPGLLLATAAEDAQWPRCEPKEGAQLTEVNEMGGRLHSGGHKAIASGVVEEEGGREAPAQQTAHDGAESGGEALQSGGKLSDASPELGSQRTNADEGLVGNKGGSGAGVLQRHVSLVSHPVEDEWPDRECGGTAALEQEAGEAGGKEQSPLQPGATGVGLAAVVGASQQDYSPDRAQPQPGSCSEGDQAEIVLQQQPGREVARASRCEVGCQENSSDCTSTERCGKPGGISKADCGSSRRGGSPLKLPEEGVSEPMSDWLLSIGGQEARQSRQENGDHADRSNEGACNGRIRETDHALVRKREASVLQEQQENGGGVPSPATSESKAADSAHRKQQAVELADPGCSVVAAGGAVSGELAGKLASRRKWEQMWEEKGRHLWSSPSVAIKERPVRGGVRRSLFGEGSQDNTTGKAGSIRDRYDSAEQNEHCSPGDTLTATSMQRPEIVTSATQPHTPDSLSTELARKLASRRKWEVSSEVTKSSA